MTLNDVMVAILCYSTEFGSFWHNYVKVVEDRPKNLVLAIYDLWQYSQRFLGTKSLDRGNTLIKLRYIWQTVRDRM